jgi:hypothetical protein
MLRLLQIAIAAGILLIQFSTSLRRARPLAALREVSAIQLAR